MTKRIKVGSQRDLQPRSVRIIPLGPDPKGLPREGLVVLDADGTPRCYLNLCKHLPIPIDSGSRDFLDEDGQYLVCGTHGALYQLEDGLCVAGPCAGESLDALPITVVDGVVFVDAPD